VFDFRREANHLETGGSPSAGDIDRLLEAMRTFNRILGVLDFEAAAIPEAVAKLVEEREGARRNRDFARSDSLRDAIRQHGWSVEDTKQGPRVLPIT
jgi:cysteinyl-tRNA synthetase